MTGDPIYEICKADIKYSDTKKSGSNIPFFDVDVAFYVFICFSYSLLNSSFKVTILFFNSRSRKSVWYSNNNLRKRLENTQKFVFDFVAFLVSLSIVYMTDDCYM